MITHNAAIEDSFGKHYYFRTGRPAQQQNGAKSLKFVDVLSAERFLRQFHREPRYWNRMLGGQPASVAPAPLKAVAELLCRGKLQVFKLSPKYRLNVRRSARILEHGSNDHVFEILRPADALLKTAKPKHLSDTQAALELVQALKLDDKQLNDLAQDLGLPGLAGNAKASIPGMSQASTGREQTLKALSKEVAQGDLIVLDHGPKKGPMAKSDWELSEVSPIQVQEVPLAPASEEELTDHIEIQLVDEDGEPVPDTAYWIKDSEGNEYEGTTDGEGKARLDEIPKGNCEISFPDTDSWS